jgi:SAM-dependent methyltransferase
MAEKAKTEKRICIACDGKKFRSYGKLLTECSKCNLVVAKKVPDSKTLKKLYEQDYFFGMEYSDYLADRPALEKNFRQRIRFLKSHLGPNSRVVEVGCAYGYFLNLIKNKSEWHKGYDVSAEGVKYAVTELGVNAVTDDFTKDRTIPKGSVDLICMWDVMEHFGEPHKNVQKAAQLLKKGGKLCFTTGNIGAFVPKKRRENWRMVHPPTHIYYFNVSNAKKLSEKYGLRVTSVRHKPTYRNLGSVLAQLVVNRKVKNKSAGLLGLIHKISKITALEKINFPLNLYDVMEVTAVKE